MKRITYAGLAFATGTAVATALTEYATTVGRVGVSVAVDVPTQDENGTVGSRTLILNPTTQFTVDDIDGVSSEEDELARFPVPDFPAIGGKAVAQKVDSEEEFPAIDEYEYDLPQVEVKPQQL